MNAAVRPPRLCYNATGERMSPEKTTTPHRDRSGPGEAPWRRWGSDIEPAAVDQLRNACRLPITVAGALMPDAHLGYGLPIGGVLATEGAVCPYAVGVDIACRMRLSVLDIAPADFDAWHDRFVRAIQRETQFGVGAEFARDSRRDHAVLQEDWSVSPVTRDQRDTAWAQLGSSGSGNHFVEFGLLEMLADDLGLSKGQYVALLSHSGSRGTGAKVCDHYSKLAMDRHRDLPKDQRHLAWLELDSAEGQEYWAAMELMGKYAAANHELIHRHIARRLGVDVLAKVENHHNFAWRETHRGRDVVVHRKGATPAGADAVGVIPGSMATPGYVVRGLGQPDSLNSAAHGAGRVMSRSQAKKRFDWPSIRKRLARDNVELISAGLDEAPDVYKDIETVMAAQADLVRRVGRFQPRLVKMAPGK